MVSDIVLQVLIRFDGGQAFSLWSSLLTNPVSDRQSTSGLGLVFVRIPRFLLSIFLAVLALRREETIPEPGGFL